jgi:hypothetical protein
MELAGTPKTQKSGFGIEFTVGRASGGGSGQFGVGFSAGRKFKEPERESRLYPRLMNVGGITTRDRPLIKPTAMNLRRFSRTPYARRAINTIKEPIAALCEAEQWEITPDPGVKSSRELDKQIQIVSDCFKKPNNDDSFRTLTEQVIEDICCCGAGPIEHQVGNDPKRPLWMWPVDGMSIQVYAGWTGKPDEARYLQTLGYGNIGGIQGIPLRNDELVYIRKDPSTENPFGFGPLEVAFATINRLLGSEEYAGNVAGNAQPENIVLFPGASDAQIQTLRSYWRNEIEGQGTTPIVGFENMKGWKLHKGTDAALYLGYQVFLIREICAPFGISPMNMGIEADVNRNTAEVAEDRDWTMAIIPMTQLLRSHWNREIIKGKLGFSQIGFKWIGLEREDEMETAKRFSIYYSTNVMTPDEERIRLGKPPGESPVMKMTKAEVEMMRASAMRPQIEEEIPPFPPLQKGGETKKPVSREDTKESK